jgi:hypothetical protein
MGQSLSVALAGAIFAGLGGADAGLALAANRPHLDPAQLVALQHTFTSSFQTTFIVCTCIAVIGVFTSLVRGKEEKVAARRT